MNLRNFPFPLLTHSRLFHHDLTVDCCARKRKITKGQKKKKEREVDEWSAWGSKANGAASCRRTLLFRILSFPSVSLFHFSSLKEMEAMRLARHEQQYFIHIAVIALKSLPELITIQERIDDESMKDDLFGWRDRNVCCMTLVKLSGDYLFDEDVQLYPEQSSL